MRIIPFFIISFILVSGLALIPTYITYYNQIIVIYALFMFIFWIYSILGLIPKK